MAGPKLPGGQEKGEAVMAIDRSLTMTPHLDEAREFQNENAGSENTLIVVDENIEVENEGEIYGKDDSREGYNIFLGDPSDDI